MATQNTLKLDVKQKDQTSTLVSFAVFGCLLHISFSVIFAGTQDILAGTRIPTTTLLFACMVPEFLVETIAPFFLKRIPHVVRVTIIFATSFVGFIVVAYVNIINWKIAGVGVVTFGLGIASISINSLSSYFTPTVMSAYAAGSGIGLFVGTLYYTALTTWFCVSPSVTIVVLSPLSILFLVSYYIINQNKHNKYPKFATHKDVAYTKLEDKDTDEEKDVDTRQEKGKKLSRRQSAANMIDDESLTPKGKMLVIGKLFSLTVLPTFMAFFAQYVSTQSVITTIAFKNAPFRPRDHYQYYTFIFMFGELIGRCHRSVLLFINFRWIYAPSCKLLWSLSVFQTMTLFFLIFESWYHFLPSVAVVLFICFCGGFTIGCLFANMLEVLHITFEGKKREFMTGYGIFPVSGGMLSAAFVGIYVEPRLFDHCISMTADSAYCFTRPNSFIDVALRCRHI